MKITCALFLLGCLCHQVFSDDITYYFMETKENWYGALSQCRLRGLELASIHYKMENDIIKADLPFDDSGFWTSGNNMGSDGYYDWIASGHWLTYTNWDVDVPGDHFTVPGCLAMLSQGTWTKTDCSGMKRFICEARKIFQRKNIYE